MILIIRSDGVALNISAAETLNETPAGVIVDFGTEENIFIIEDFTLDRLYKWTEGFYSNLIKVPGEWKGWPE